MHTITTYSIPVHACSLLMQRVLFDSAAAEAQTGNEGTPRRSLFVIKPSINSRKENS